MIASLSSGAETAAGLFNAKWDRNAFVASALPSNNLKFGTADPESLGKKLQYRRIGNSVRRRLGDPDLQLLPSIRSGAPVTNSRS